MNVIALKSLFNAVTPIADNEWNDFETFFSEKFISKNDYLWKYGDVCKHLVFINSGLIRVYKDTETKEIITHFYFENNLFYDDYSFVSLKPCMVSYQALEDTKLIIISRDAINLMYDKYKSFERLGRLIIEQSHIQYISEQENIKNMSSKQKYEKLISEHPKILKRVPLKYIASYLNMTPEYLSKLRNELVRKTNF